MGFRVLTTSLADVMLHSPGNHIYFPFETERRAVQIAGLISRNPCTMSMCQQCQSTACSPKICVSLLLLELIGVELLVINVVSQTNN